MNIMLFIIFFTISSLYNSFNINEETLDLNQQFSLSGPNETTIQEITWIDLTQIENKSDFEKFKEYAKKHYRFFKPSLQNTLNSSDYSYKERSNILTNYLKENTKTLDNIWNIKSWYLFIKFTQKPIGKVFLYFHNWEFKNWRKASWNLDISKSLEYVSDRSYIFNLNSIPIERYNDKQLEYYNRQKDINSKKPQYIWWFVSQFDGTSIEEIIIAWE